LLECMVEEEALLSAVTEVTGNLTISNTDITMSSKVETQQPRAALENNFINRDNTKEDVFVNQTAIKKKNPRKYLLEGEKGAEAANVTGPGGVPVQSNKYAADRNHRHYPRHRGGPSPNYQPIYQNSEVGEKPEEAEIASEGDGSNQHCPYHGRHYPPYYLRRPYGRRLQYSNAPIQGEGIEGQPRSRRTRQTSETEHV
uniref:Uncharacterized protein n=1 Tax=Leptobrachium leishanense TaxID=445787 RepID=A0A8C5QV09_9ANUR